MNNYYLGLDIGTDSVGWAVTDLDYNILKFKGNAMWGIRLLEGGQTAEERRTFRNARRRVQRNKYRISCLEALFNEEISKIDNSFFQRLKDSQLYENDKSVSGKYSIFNDDNYSDINYYSDYPTIYHLRIELIENDEKHDVRLLYLAVSHIIKNRGHFLFESEDLGKNGNDDFAEIWAELNIYLQDNYEKEFYCETADIIQNVENILKDRSLTVTKKKEALIKLFGFKKKDDVFEIAVLSLISGATVKARDLFVTDEYNDSEAKSINFKNGYEDKVSIYEQVYAEKFELIEKLKAIYDWAVLADIRNGQKYISYAKIDIFEKHKNDLKLLKKFVKNYIPEKYNLIFNENKKDVCNYLSYSGHLKKAVVIKKCDQEKFCEFLKKQLPKELPDEKYSQMYDEIAAGSFMPKIVSKDNSVIPMQLNRIELEKILSNAEKYCEFLKKEDENGKTVKDKIIDVFNFRIPYYVGPLNTHSDKHWVVRNNEKIYPWNFEQVVDVEKSAQAFIENLTSKCTYLPREDVLAKNSLLYSAFMVLNELNNLKIDGKPVSVELKQNIYNDLFLNRNKVTNSALKNYLKSNGYSNVIISGIDGDFKSSLKPFRDLNFIDLPDNDKEEIIKAVTIFGDDKKLLKKRLNKVYGSKISTDDIQKIAELKYKDWGRLSKKLLIGIEATLQNGTGELTNIIHAMWETNNNLMELLGNKYEFCKRIEEENSTVEFTTLKDEVEKLYVSPKIKRPIYQTMKIVDEIVKIKGHEPQKIFIEVARQEGEKKRTESRKQRLLNLYKDCKKTQEELYLQLQKIDDNEFKRDSLYLYFTQFGRCMYTGETISLENIYNRNIYDIDHIFPQSKINDDSLDNRVLVLKTANVKKDKVYPISSDIRKNMTPFWKELKERGLISQKKFDRLTRNYALTDDEIVSFCNRQLVETRQSTKAVAQLLKKRYPHSAVEYVKAGLVSDFRQKYEMVKCRDVNDYHHAKDAYLNIVVGNVHTVRARKSYFINNIQSGKWSMKTRKVFSHDVKDAWVAENDQSLKTVKSVMSKNNIRFTRFFYKKKGGLFDQNPLKKGSGQIPRKNGMSIEKYGGYNKASVTYFAFVQYQNSKGKCMRSFVPVHLYLEKEYLNNPTEYIKKYLNVSDVQIIIPCVKISSLISIDGLRLHIASYGDNHIACNPAIQLVVSQKQEQYIKKISNYIEKCKELKTEKEVTEFDKITFDENMQLYDLLIDKCVNTIYKVKFSDFGKKLFDKRTKFSNLSLYQQCYVLKQIVDVIHADAVCGNFEYIEIKNSRIRINVNISGKYNSFKLINQSITGLFEQEVDLLK